MTEAGSQPQSRPAGSVARLLSCMSYYYVTPQDFWTLIAGGHTDARLAALETAHGSRGAFEALYDASADPWDTLNPRLTYQERKYRTVMALLPQHRFARALDLGCGLGTLAVQLAGRADSVLGVDVAQTAVDRARQRHGSIANLAFAQGDIAELPDALGGGYDLITIMDTLYYLPSTSDTALDDVATRIAAMLAPGGIVVLSNHLFAGGWDKATLLSRRIDRAFCRSARLKLVSRHWHPFFQTTILGLST
jgi:2-polyprenyl-3-methyl-5-hydroxy-6-metoxy-1,4-benzoquinol methylase